MFYLDLCKHALSYNLRVKKVDHSTDSSKRNFLIAGAATASVVPKVFADAQAVVANANGLKSDKRKTPITPPGSISRAHFQNKCTSCHLCVSKCPSHGRGVGELVSAMEGLTPCSRIVLPGSSERYCEP